MSAEIVEIIAKLLDATCDAHITIAKGALSSFPVNASESSVKMASFGSALKNNGEVLLISNAMVGNLAGLSSKLRDIRGPERARVERAKEVLSFRLEILTDQFDLAARSFEELFVRRQQLLRAASLKADLDAARSARELLQTLIARLGSANS
jgi:hypothetical protein